MNLSSFTKKAFAAAIVLASTAGVAFAGHSYKGENYKGEMAAAPCPVPPSLMDGFYLGGQLGYDSYRIRTSYSASDLAASGTMAANGWVGGLFIGYGQYFNNMYYLAGEIFGNISGAEQTNSLTTFNDATFGTVTGNTKFEANGSYGISLLPGIKLNDTTLGYVRLGYNWASLKARASANFPLFPGFNTSRSKTNTSGGFDFGVGLETLLYQNWSLRGEFNHTYYNSFNAFGAKFNPSDNQYTMGIVYHFA